METLPLTIYDLLQLRYKLTITLWSQPYDKARRLKEIFLEFFETIRYDVRMIFNEQKSEARVQNTGDFEICDL